MIEDYDSLHDHIHLWEPMRLICEICGVTKEQIAAGRDRAPTWDDVDDAFQDGQNLGIELGRLLYKNERRQKLIEVGYYLCLRRLGQSIDTKDEE